MGEAVAFDGQDDFDRMAKAVRKSEEMARSERPIERGPVLLGPSVTAVLVTKFNPTTGVYTGVYCFRDKAGGARRWMNSDEGCLVVGVNDEKLVVGKRYLGFVSGVTESPEAGPTDINEGLSEVVVIGQFPNALDINVCPIYGDVGEPTHVTGIRVMKVFSDGTISCVTNAEGCCQVSYNCVDGTCVEVAGAGGSYSTLAGCQSGCLNPEDTFTCDNHEWPRRLCCTLTMVDDADLADTLEGAGTVVTAVATYNPGLSVGTQVAWDVYFSFTTEEGHVTILGGTIYGPCDPDDWRAGTPGVFNDSNVYFVGSGQVWIVNNYTGISYVFGTFFGPTALNQFTTTADPDPLHIEWAGLNFSMDVVPFAGSCTPPEVISFDCVNGTCVQVSGNSGEHETLEDCEAAPCVLCCEEEERPSFLCGIWSNFVGEVWEGDSPADEAMTRDGTVMWIHNTFGTLAVWCDGDGVWNLAGNDLLFGGGIGAPDTVTFVSATCDPFLVVFDIAWAGGISTRLSFMEGDCCEVDPMTGLTITFDPPAPVTGEEVVIIVTPTGGTGPFLYGIDFGDGSDPLEGSGSGRFEWTYPVAGTYTVSATIQDIGCPALEGEFAEGEEDVTVSPPTSPCETYETTVTGDLYTLTADGTGHWSGLFTLPSNLFAPSVSGSGDWELSINLGACLYTAPDTWDGSGCQTFTKDGDCGGGFPDETVKVCCTSGPGSGATCADAVTGQPGLVTALVSAEVMWFYLGVAQPGTTDFDVSGVASISTPAVDCEVFTGTCEALDDTLQPGTFTFGAGGGTLGITITNPDTPVWVRVTNGGVDDLDFDYAWSTS